jgi:hypothetical protein
MNMMTKIDPLASLAQPGFEWKPPAALPGEATLPADAPDLPWADADNDEGAPSALRYISPLDRTERSAVLLSRDDGRASLAGNRAGAWLGRLISGSHPSARLSGDRLEALRRYAILYRLEGAKLPAGEEARLLGLGYSGAQAASVRAMVDAMDLRPRRKRGWLTGLVLLAVAASAVTLLDAWLARQVDDPLSALVVTIALVTGVVSMLAVSAHPGARAP